MNIINTLNISIDNRYINILLGGKPLQGVITGGLLVEHVFWGIVLAILCIPVPLATALKITPAREIS